jgi:peptidoglycan hydrolase-like protein with peptidoglycan-binding domain
VFENFAADVQNTCEPVSSDPDCLRVAALTFGGSKVVESGELVGRIQGLPLPTTEDEASGDPIVEPVPTGQPTEGTTAMAPSATDSEAGQGHSDLTERDPADPQHDISPDDRMSADGQVAKIQRALRKLGYDPGPADNLIGPRTLSAILAYQRRQGLEPNGQPSRELLEHIMKSNSDGSE